MSTNRNWSDAAGRAVTGARRKAEQEVAEFKNALSQVRRARKFTQAQMAKALKVSQPEISRIEGQADLLVSTLANFVKAMDGDLEIYARFGDRRVQLRFSDLVRSATASTPRKTTRKAKAGTRTTARRKTTARKTTARKSTTSRKTTAASGAKKTTTRKPAAKKTTTRKSTAKKTTTRKPAAKKTATRKPAAKKAAARKAPTRTPAKKASSAKRRPSTASKARSGGSAALATARPTSRS